MFQKLGASYTQHCRISKNVLEYNILRIKAHTGESFRMEMSHWGEKVMALGMSNGRKGAKDGPSTLPTQVAMLVADVTFLLESGGEKKGAQRGEVQVHCVCVYAV